MGKTNIEWTDNSWPVFTGCTRVSEGCRRCYSERLTATRLRHLPAYNGLAILKDGDARWTGEVRFNEKVLCDPLKWRKPRRIFVCQMSDLFHEKAEDEWIDKVFAVMALAQWHTFQVLTKRPARMAEYVRSRRGRAWRAADGLYEDLGLQSPFNVAEPWPLPNVWLGVSAEEQKTADERVPLLLATPAAIRWVSYEPALGPVYFSWLKPAAFGDQAIISDREAIRPGLHWVVCGGESGPGARPMDTDWARSARDQCIAADVPFFFKQIGEWVAADHELFGRLPERELCWMRGDGSLWPAPPADENADCLTMKRVGKKAAGRLLDGEEWSQYPKAAKI